MHNVNFAGADLAKSVFAETFGGVLSVAVSQNGKLLATGDANGEIQIWQVEDGVKAKHLAQVSVAQTQALYPNALPLVTCKGHTGWIRAVAFSPDIALSSLSRE